MGFKQTALDEAARHGFANAAFEFSEEEIPELLEEFYPNSQEDGGAANEVASKPVVNHRPSLKDKLDSKARRVESA